MIEFGVLQFVVAVLGVFVGIIFGAIPGMTATMAIAIFLPLTYAYDLNTSLYLLLGLYVGGISGGLIPAILINIPGTPSSITTGFDGHPMAKRGEGERALKIGITASLLGGMISLAALCFKNHRIVDGLLCILAPGKRTMILAQHCRNCHYILLHAFKFRNNQVSGIFFVSRVNLFLRQTSHTGDFSVEIIRMSRTITGNRPFPWKARQQSHFVYHCPNLVQTLFLYSAT